MNYKLKLIVGLIFVSVKLLVIRILLFLLAQFYLFNFSILKILTIFII